MSPPIFILIGQKDIIEHIQVLFNSLTKTLDSQLKHIYFSQTFLKVSHAKKLTWLYNHQLCFNLSVIFFSNFTFEAKKKHFFFSSVQLESNMKIALNCAWSFPTFV